MDILNLGLLLTLHPEPVMVRSQPVPLHCARLCLEGQMKPKRLLAVEIDFLLVGLRLRPEVLAGWPAIKTVLKPERFPFLPPPAPRPQYKNTSALRSGTSHVV